MTDAQAGNPYDKILREGTSAILEPRKSFKLWSETVLGKSKGWTDEQLETASVLCLVYGKFIDVWRQKQTALRSNQLTTLLLSNASHEGVLLLLCLSGAARADAIAQCGRRSTLSSTTSCVALSSAYRMLVS